MRVLPGIFLVGAVAQAASAADSELHKRGAPVGDTFSILIHDHPPRHLRGSDDFSSAQSSVESSPSRDDLSPSTDVAPRISFGETLSAAHREPYHDQIELARVQEHRILFPETETSHGNGHHGEIEPERKSFAFVPPTQGGSPISSADSLGHTPPLSHSGTPRHPDMDRDLISLPHPRDHEHLSPVGTPRTPRTRTGSAFWDSMPPGTPPREYFGVTPSPSHSLTASPQARPSHPIYGTSPIIPFSRPPSPPQNGLQEAPPKRSFKKFVKDHGCCIATSIFCFSVCGAAAGLSYGVHTHKRDVGDDSALALERR